MGFQNGKLPIMRALSNIDDVCPLGSGPQNVRILLDPYMKHPYMKLDPYKARFRLPQFSITNPNILPSFLPPLVQFVHTNQ